MIHNFDTDIAQKYGILEAILLNNIYYWIEKNKANETNFYDGTYWTYNSTRAFRELFSYATERQIKSALMKLREEGILLTGNYNKSPYDRTLWYALSEKGLSIVQNCPINSEDMSNEKDKTVQSKEHESTMSLSQNVQPIPDIKPYIKPDNKTDKKDFSSELENPAPEPEQKTQVINLPLNTGEEYPIFQNDIDIFAELYPAVDILQAMRAMKGWLMTNSKKRKTKRGISRFINSWLAREQDKGGNIRSSLSSTKIATAHQERIAELVKEQAPTIKNENVPEVMF